MGIPAPAGVAASGTPPPGDQANAVLSGTITAIGPQTAFAFRGPMNLWLYASINTALTTTAGSTAATVGSGTGLAAGDAINSVNVPPGTVAAVVSGTNVTLKLPPGVAASGILTGTDTAATFTGAAIVFSATVQLERSFDGGKTFIVCNLGGGGILAQWLAGPISITFGEPEKNVLYRLNCTVWTSGTINYRISQTGGAAESLAVGPLSGG